MSPFTIAGALLATLAGVCAVQAQNQGTRSQDTNIALGVWRGVIEGKGGEVPFGIEFTRAEGNLRATLINGSERRGVGRVEEAPGRLVLHFDPYDSRIEAELAADGKRLEGAWLRYRDADTTSSLPFSAAAGEQPRFQLIEMKRLAKFELDGRWSVDFEHDENPAVGLFESDGVRATGTFLTTLGDYRYLAGVFDGQILLLSVFDGAHAFRFEAHAQEDGTLAGKFFSRDVWQETFSARRDERAELPDPFQLTQATNAQALGQLSFPNLYGERRRLDEPIFHGQARLIVLFGSWCPNCYDESEYLVELSRRFGERGLAIQGLAFEFGDDLERQTRVLTRYAEHHGIEFPILIAGTSDKAEASKAFPVLDRVRSYPTTLFLDHKNEIRAIYTGFSGPATGETHQKLREGFELLIEMLLSEEK